MVKFCKYSCGNCHAKVNLCDGQVGLVGKDTKGKLKSQQTWFLHLCRTFVFNTLKFFRGNPLFQFSIF